MKSLGQITNRNHRRAGWGSALRSLGVLAFSALPLAILLPMLNCSPGTLDCAEVGDKPGASEFCSDSGGGGNGGGGQGGAGNEPVVCDVDAVKGATLENCAAHATVADFEKDFLQARCGSGMNEANCHHGKTYPPLYKEGEDIFTKMVGVDTILVCGNEDDDPTWVADKLINMDDALKSMFYLKVLGDKQECPGGNPDPVLSGDRMPYNKETEPEPELTDEERNCVKSYVEAVVANCNP